MGEEGGGRGEEEREEVKRKGEAYLLAPSIGLFDEDDGKWDVCVLGGVDRVVVDGVCPCLESRERFGEAQRGGCLAVRLDHYQQCYSCS